MAAAMAAAASSLFRRHESSPGKQENPPTAPTFLGASPRTFPLPADLLPAAEEGALYQPRQTFIRKSPCGAVPPASFCLLLPRDCFQSTEEPKLARDKGAAFPAAEPRGPDQLLLLGDRGCFGCHLLQSQVSSSAGTWSEEEEGNGR